MTKLVNIIDKIESAGLVGRGGASFSVAKKWKAVKESSRKHKEVYIIVNGAEGEPGVKKDSYILNHYSEDVLNGIFFADKYFGSEKVQQIYFFLNSEYFKKYSPILKNILKAKKYSVLEKKIKFIVKGETLSYISGEESAIINIIEGKKIEPRLKPPYPTNEGLFSAPTLINNIETFYNISLVNSGCFKNERFYTLSGAVRHRGVFSLPAELSIEEVLKKTDNIPDFKFFVQCGGEASGEILRSDQLNRPVEGAGSIMVYDFKKTDHDKLLKYWLHFYYIQSCGNCTICREGTYRLWELVNQKNYNKKLFWELISGLEETSFCALGRSLPVPVKSYYSNILQAKF